VASSDFRGLAKTDFTSLDRKQAAFFAADSADPTNKDRQPSRRLRLAHGREQSPADRAISSQTVVALVVPDCTSRAATEYAIDPARVISIARESALDSHHHRAAHAVSALIIAISVRVSPISVRVAVGIRVTPPRIKRKTEVIEKDEFVETVEASKPIISIEVAVVEAVEATKPTESIEVAVAEISGGRVEHWATLNRATPDRSSVPCVPSHLRRRRRDRENGWHHATEENEFFPVHNVVGFLKIKNPVGFESCGPGSPTKVTRGHRRGGTLASVGNSQFAFRDPKFFGVLSPASNVGP
jgi:hypothetical protein